MIVFGVKWEYNITVLNIINVALCCTCMSSSGIEKAREKEGLNGRTSLLFQKISMPLQKVSVCMF